MICSGIENTFCAPLMLTYTLKVPPTGCEMVVGSKLRVVLPADTAAGAAGVAA